ncbi:MAG: hypothetical protein R6T83_09310 [Salinibacter sp.]
MSFYFPTFSPRVLALISLLLSPALLHAQDPPDPAPPGDPNTPCTRETDEFKQQTVTRCEPLSAEVEEQPAETIYRVRVVLGRLDGEAYLLVSTVSESWNFLRDDTAYALIDDENHEFQLMEIDREVDGGQVAEQNALMLDAEALDALASAAEVRVKVGQAVLRLPADALQAHAQALQDA